MSVLSHTDLSSGTVGSSVGSRPVLSRFVLGWWWVTSTRRWAPPTPKAQETHEPPPFQGGQNSPYPPPPEGGGGKNRQHGGQGKGTRGQEGRGTVEGRRKGIADRVGQGPEGEGQGRAQ